MSATREQTIAVVAVVVLLASMAATWQVADVRADQAEDRRVDDLVNSQVPSRQAANDYDGDGVGDATDRCPTRPETTNNFQDGDGCPDLVATTGAS